MERAGYPRKSSSIPTFAERETEFEETILDLTGDAMAISCFVRCRDRLRDGELYSEDGMEDVESRLRCVLAQYVGETARLGKWLLECRPSGSVRRETPLSGRLKRAL